jgi:hypothetical protein
MFLLARHGPHRAAGRRCVAYGYGVDAFAWTVISSVAGVVGAAAAIVFWLVSLLSAKTTLLPEASMPSLGKKIYSHVHDGAVQ